MNSHRVELVAGEVLFRESDPPDAAYLVERGRLAITAGSDQRRIAEVGAGELLGEMAVIDRSPRTATATALEPCVLLAITPEQIAERLLNTDPVVRALLEGQLRRYRQTLAQSLGQGSQIPEGEGTEALLGIDKIRLEGELRDALREGQLEARFQPLLEIRPGRVAGYEALVRWRHPRRGWISPAEFIALAEETSLILPVGDYVLELALDALMHLDDARPDQAQFVAINVSARQLLEEGLLARMLERIQRRSLDPGRIKIELTESRALDPIRVAVMMQQARLAGMKVALDDFGTGYSNLQYMHLLPFDTLKVDQAFVRNMHESTRALRIVESIVGMAHALGADVVVEGVETAVQLEQLAAMGCRYAQGWWVGKPQKLSELRHTDRPP
ncbi:MAG: EAL domain-containing protein [Aquimonas sp.]|nr:EAL domain-containing protein [Aquimonas sp.]